MRGDGGGAMLSYRVAAAGPLYPAVSTYRLSKNCHLDRRHTHSFEGWKQRHSLCWWEGGKEGGDNEKPARQRLALSCLRAAALTYIYIHLSPVRQTDKYNSPQIKQTGSRLSIPTRICAWPPLTYVTVQHERAPGPRRRPLPIPTLTYSF